MSMDNPKTPPLTEHVSRKASGRRPTRKSMATRQSILDTAAAIFAKNGYSLTRLNDIADSVGIHLTGLYYYYDSKEALVTDIITYVPTRVSTALKEALGALPPTASYRQRIEAAFAAYLDSILKDDAYVRAEHRIASQIAPKLRKRSLKVTQEINELWRKLLEDAVAAGEVRSDIDMTMLRMLMIGSMNWAVEWFRPGMAPPSHLAEAMKTLFFDGAAASTGKAARGKASSARARRSK
jgi:AcrR family transcriptional regulator